MKQIHEGSNASQWRYVPSKMNPAEDVPLSVLKGQTFFGTRKLLGQQKEQKQSLMNILK